MHRISGWLSSLLCAAATVAVIDTAYAQPMAQDAPQRVGLPGCESDVPVAASRSQIFFPSQGREVPALLYEPQGTRRAGSALVIMHGRSVQDDLTELDHHAIQLASRGFAVILPFYLHVRREGENSSQALVERRAWRRVAVDAAESLAIEMGLEPRRVLLWGNTRGGGLALGAALDPGSPVGGAVGVNIGGWPQDDAQGAGRPFLLAYSATFPAREVRTMANRIRERGGLVEHLEIAADYDQFATSDWCRIMDGTRGLLERLAVASPRS